MEGNIRKQKKNDTKSKKAMVPECNVLVFMIILSYIEHIKNVL